MPETTDNHLHAFGLSGMPYARIEAALGRKLTDKEKVVVERGRAVRDLRRMEKKARGPMSGAEKKAAWSARHAMVERKECADQKRKKKLEADPAKWLRHYLPQAYTRQFDKPHIEIIAGAMKANDTGGRFLVAGERGIGKSVLLFGIVLLLAMTSRRRFPVYLPWSANIMKRGFSFWRNALAFNEHLLADYPEYCQPFAHARGISQKMASLHWADTEQPCGGALQISDGMIILPDSRGVIGGSTVNGNPRGLNLPQPDGTVLRPDIAFVDDPQDRQVAKSLVLTDETCMKIDGDIAGLGSAGAGFPLLMSGNCICDGDVMARYLADPNWRSMKVACVETWPDGWADKGVSWQLWRDWWAVYQADQKAAAAFYRKKKREMTSGFRLTAPHAYSASVSRWLPDAECVAMRQYWQMGHEAFMAERQQAPLSKEELAPFALTVDLITSRVDETRKVHEVPPWSRMVLASSDINDYGLSSVIGAAADDQTAGVIWYGIIDRSGHPLIDANVPEATKAQQLFDGLVRAGEALGNCAERPTAWAIDAGYMGPVVRRYADTIGRKCGMQIILCRGLSGKSYKPGFRAIGKPRENCHMTDWPLIGRGLAWNADACKEIMQRAWLGEVGKPGSISLFSDANHRNFAEQIWRERLLGKSIVGGVPVWVFARQPGPHDFGDALAQWYALLAWHGIGTAGGGAVVAKKAAYFSSKPRR